MISFSVSTLLFPPSLIGAPASMTAGQIPALGALIMADSTCATWIYIHPTAGSVVYGLCVHYFFFILRRNETSASSFALVRFYSLFMFYSSIFCFFSSIYDFSSIYLIIFLDENGLSLMSTCKWV